jgi:hypothetical protein
MPHHPTPPTRVSIHDFHSFDFFLVNATFVVFNLLSFDECICKELDAQCL